VRIKSAALDLDGRVDVEYAEADTGTTSYRNQAYRVKIEGDQKALYFYWIESASAMAHALQSEGFDTWIEEKETDCTGTWWVRTEKV